MTGDYKEFSIYWIQGEKRASISCSSLSSLGKKLIKLSESRPDDVTIDKINDDGMMFAHVPVKYVKVNAPRVVPELSEERKAALREQSERARMARKNIKQHD